MNPGEEFVENFLMHYASEYYDPAKAREYYLRNRELKGRQSTSGLSEEGKQTWAYTKNQIGVAKKEKLQEASEARKNFVERARQLASARREEISNKLSALLEAITQERSQRSEDLSAQKESALEQLAAQQKAKSDQLRQKAEAEIAALPRIPENIGEAQRARLMTQRQRKIDKIRGTLSSDLDSLAAEGAKEEQAISDATAEDRTALANYTQGQREQERTKATVTREEVSTELKATVDKARADYEALKEKLTADFEATTQREYDAIRGTMAAPPSSKKSSDKKKDKDKDKGSGSKPGQKSITLQEAAEQFVKRQNSK